MKSTKIMVAFIATTLLTWLFVSFIVYMALDSVTYREAATNGGMGLFMLTFGWTPGVIVCTDLEQKLEA